jgi:two-component system, OmpR family, sensor histidine kinase VanS
VRNAIIHNLLEHGAVSVTTCAHPKNVVLTVEDTGEKLSAQEVATLVEPFLRGFERVSTAHAGVSLGLAIVKSITQAPDGTLTLTPRAGGDSASRCNYPPRRRSRGGTPDSIESG